MIFALNSKKYGVKLNPKAGKDNHEMVEGIHDGQIHSLYLYGEDTGIVDSNINFVQAAFEKLDFMVVQDEFLTFTATYADVVLPASPSLEKMVRLRIQSDVFNVYTKH